MVNGQNIAFVLKKPYIFNFVLNIRGFDIIKLMY